MHTGTLPGMYSVVAASNVTRPSRASDVCMQQLVILLDPAFCAKCSSLSHPVSFIPCMLLHFVTRGLAQHVPADCPGLKMHMLNI